MYTLAKLHKRPLIGRIPSAQGLEHLHEPVSSPRAEHFEPVDGMATLFGSGGAFAGAVKCHYRSDLSVAYRSLRLW